MIRFDHIGAFSPKRGMIEASATRNPRCRDRAASRRPRTGCSPSTVGTLPGVFFISILGNALVLYGVNSYAPNIVRGAVVLLAVLVTNLQAGKLGAKD